MNSSKCVFFLPLSAKKECSHGASRGKMLKQPASGPKTDGKSGEVGQGQEELKRKRRDAEKSLSWPFIIV